MAGLKTGVFFFPCQAWRRKVNNTPPMAANKLPVMRLNATRPTGFWRSHGAMPRSANTVHTDNTLKIQSQ